MITSRTKLRNSDNFIFMLSMYGVTKYQRRSTHETHGAANVCDHKNTNTCHGMITVCLVAADI